MKKTIFSFLALSLVFSPFGGVSAATTDTRAESETRTRTEVRGLPLIKPAVDRICGDDYVLSEDEGHCVRRVLNKLQDRMEDSRDESDARVEVDASVTIDLNDSEDAVIFNTENQAGVTVRDESTESDVRMDNKERIRAVLMIRRARHMAEGSDEMQGEDGQEVEEEVVVESDADSNEATISVRDRMAKVRGKLEIRDNRIFLRDREVKIMPDRAAENAIEKLGAKQDVQVELRSVGQDKDSRIVYDVEAFQDVKILGLFKAKMKVKTTVDAESSEVGEVQRPWWSFLAF